MSTGIVLTGLSKTYESRDGSVEALRSLDLAIADGEFLSVLGPSGCGKTTLLKMLGGLLKPTSGTVDVDGATLWGHKGPNMDVLAEFGFVFQGSNLLPWYRTIDNVALPLRIRNVPRAERLARARELCSLVGIDGFERNWPDELSGGMQQRAAIARALVYEPSVLLMDEPFGALDALTRDRLNVELMRIWATKRKTVVFVTHSIPEALLLGDRVVVMTARPGKIDRVIEVPFERPRSLDLHGHPDFQQMVSEIRETFEQDHAGGLDE